MTDLGGSITYAPPQNKPPNLRISPDLPAPFAGPIWGGAADLVDLMSAVERLDDEGGGTPRPDPITAAAATGEAVAEPAKSRARLRPLLALSPMLSPHLQAGLNMILHNKLIRLVPEQILGIKPRCGLT